MTRHEPEQARQADQHNGGAIRDEHDVDQVLRGAETYDGKPERNGGDRDDHQAQLPGLGQDTQAKPAK